MREGRIMPDAALVDEFCDALWLEDGLSMLTIDAYRRDLSQMAKWLIANGHTLADANEEGLLRYVQARHAAGTRASSSNRRLSAMRRFYRWMIRQNRRAADPSAGLDSARQAARFPKSLSEADVERLLGAPDCGSILGLRDRAMLEQIGRAHV